MTLGNNVLTVNHLLVHGRNDGYISCYHIYSFGAYNIDSKITNVKIALMEEDMFKMLKRQI